MKAIQNVWSWLSGKKTFIVSTAAVVYAMGIKYNVWPHQSWLDLLFAATATATIRHGISQNDPSQIIAQMTASDAPPVGDKGATQLKQGQV